MIGQNMILADAEIQGKRQPDQKPRVKNSEDFVERGRMDNRRIGKNKFVIIKIQGFGVKGVGINGQSNHQKNSQRIYPMINS